MQDIETIKLSVVDTERKYSIEYGETAYGQDSIVSYGKDNNMPILLRNCYRNSATLKSVIDGIVNYVLGDDIEVSDGIALLREQVNRSGMSMRQFIASITLDYMIYGGFAFQVIYSDLYVPVELYPLDFARCRTNESGTKVFYSRKNWTKYGTKALEFDRFDRKHINPDKKTQIFFFKGDFTKNVYPLPTWYGALNDVLTEIECSKYSLNTVSNGFQAKYLFNIPDSSNLTETQKKDIEDGIRSKFCGTDSTSNFMLYFTDGENKLEITKIESDDAPEKYIAIKDNARSNIYTALRTTPLLMGLPTASNGFSTNEYRDSYKLFQKNVIAPVQDVIKESLAKVFNEKEPVKITPYLITFDE